MPVLQDARLTPSLRCGTFSVLVQVPTSRNRCLLRVIAVAEALSAGRAPWCSVLVDEIASGVLLIGLINCVVSFGLTLVIAKV